MYVRGLFIMASLHFPAKPVLLNTEDPTVPSIVLGEKNKELQAAVVVINTSAKALNGLQMKTTLSGKTMTTNLPAVPPMSSRKVFFRLDGSGVTATGKMDCQITLLEKGKVLDEAKIQLKQ